MKERDDILDLIRGLSALVVMLAHLRSFLLVDLCELDHRPPWISGFYFLTGIHHQAVMVFFVLSGYFVGGSVLQGIRSKTFSAGHYALARLTRLWVVLIPALFLTASLDFAGMAVAPDAYQGSFRQTFNSGPDPASGISLDWTTWMANLAFLQTINQPVFGTNGPLWSLANEFWYYALFPLIAAALLLRSEKTTILVRGALLCGFCFLCWWLPAPLLGYCLIWLMGVAAWRLSRSQNLLRIARSIPYRSITGLVFLATLAASKTNSPIGSDFVIGLTFAIWLPSIIGPTSKMKLLFKLGTGLSAISYTLYVTHFPLQFWLAATVFEGKQFQPKGLGVLWYGASAILSLGLATLMWWLFERRTDSIRKFLAEVLKLRTRSKDSPIPHQLHDPVNQ